jgi:hypothetical protein
LLEKKIPLIVPAKRLEPLSTNADIPLGPSALSIPVLVCTQFSPSFEDEYMPYEFPTNKVSPTTMMEETSGYKMAPPVVKPLSIAIQVAPSSVDRNTPLAPAKTVDPFKEKL